MSADLNELAKEDPALAEALAGAAQAPESQEPVVVVDGPTPMEGAVEGVDDNQVAPQAVVAEQEALRKLNEELDDEQPEVEVEVEAEVEAEVEVEAEAEAEANPVSVNFSAGNEKQAQAIRAQQIRDRQKVIDDAQDEVNTARAAHLAGVAGSIAKNKSFKQLTAEGPVNIGGSRTPHRTES